MSRFPAHAAQLHHIPKGIGSLQAAIQLTRQNVPWTGGLGQLLRWVWAAAVHRGCRWGPRAMGYGSASGTGAPACSPGEAPCSKEPEGVGTAGATTATNQPAEAVVLLNAAVSASQSGGQGGGVASCQPQLSAHRVACMAVLSQRLARTPTARGLPWASPRSAPGCPPGASRAVSGDTLALARPGSSQSLQLEQGSQPHTEMEFDFKRNGNQTTLLGEARPQRWPQQLENGSHPQEKGEENTEKTIAAQLPGQQPAAIPRSNRGLGASLEPQACAPRVCFFRYRWFSA